jgi:alginate O-acetyltransferase complex protein AlgJ
MDVREAMALAEIEATRVAPSAARTLTAAFLAAIAVVPVVQIAGEFFAGAGPLSSLAAVPAAVASAFSDARREGAALVWALRDANREAQRQIDSFDDAIEDDTWLSRRVRGPVQLALTGMVGVGNQQTQVGRNGWLYFDPDVRYVTGAGFLDPRQLTRRIDSASSWETPPQPDPRVAILDFKRQLDARGIALVIMPVPGKATIHPERLSSRYQGPEGPQNPSYASFVRDLEANGVIVSDATRAIAAARAGGADAYLATDTHWRPEVVRGVAEQLAGLLVERVGLERAASPYRLETASAANLGDLAILLDLPVGTRLFPPEPVTIWRVVDETGVPWRPTPGADVLLLGDSFTNIYSQAAMGWGSAAGLAEHLSMALGRPVDRIVQNDQGAHATRELLARQIAEDPDRLATVRVVVYQFAARELTGGDWRVVGSRQLGIEN